MSLAYDRSYQQEDVQVDWYERMMLTGGRADRRRREAKKRKKLRKLVLLGLTGVLVLLLVAGYISGLVKIIQLKSDISRVQAEITDVNGEIAQLEEEKARVESPEYIEQTAREKLRLVMPGEIKYVVTEGTDEGSREKDVKVRQDSYQEPLY